MSTSLSQTAYQHLVYLAQTIGARPIGSANNRKAGSSIQQYFKQWGLQVRLQEYPCADWKSHHIHLNLDCATLRAAVNPFSPSCDVQVPLAAVGTLDELQQTDLSGKIAVLYGALVGQEQTPPAEVIITEADSPAADGQAPAVTIHIVQPASFAQILQDKTPAAVILVHPHPRTCQPLIENWEFPIPSATAPAESGRALLQANGQTARLQITSRTEPSTTCNVIGSLPGERSERLMLCAHYDTKHNTPGAYDNASGTAVLLALAEQFASLPHRYALEFTAFSGEESGGTDVAAYLDDSPDLEHILALINIDGVGQITASNNATAVSGSEQFNALVRQVVDQFPGVVWTKPWASGDHYAFAMQGVPCIPVSTCSPAEIKHTPQDTVDWISPDGLGEAARLVHSLVQMLGEQSMEWCRE